MARSGSVPVTLGVRVPSSASTVPAATAPSRHSALVRVTHWIIALCFLALLVSGIEILISHPRFYWGETGNVLTSRLFKMPIPSSRSLVPTGYGYVLPDQNGWSRYLHFQAAWIAVLTGLLYVISAFFYRTFSEKPAPGRSRSFVAGALERFANHLRFKRPSAAEAWSYNVLQRLTYLFVIFVLFPLVIWTGLAMSLAFVSAFPASVTLLGGEQSARTIHFFVSVALVFFLLVHVVMVCFAGFRSRMRAMITGRVDAQKERHERSLAPQTDQNRTRRRRGRIGPGRGRALGAKLWPGPARSRRNLGPRRNADLCFPAAADEALVGP